MWGQLGFAPELMDAHITVTPACGLAGASIGWATTAMRLARQAAKVLSEEPLRA